MSKTYQKYANTDLQLIVDGHTYTVDVTAHGIYTHTPGRRYMPNGDPGYPDEDDFEIEDVEAVWYNEDGKQVAAMPEMDDKLTSYLEDEAEWEDVEEPEPPDDYYEERAMARWEARCDRAGV